MRKRYNCPIEGCNWEGTKLVQYHLPIKHKIDPVRAKNVAQNATVVGQIQSDEGTKVDELLTAFAGWLASMEGGKYVAPNLPAKEQKEKNSANNIINSEDHTRGHGTFIFQEFPASAC